MELKYKSESFVDFVERLLIVPYGIEIMMGHASVEMTQTFNRTLWN